MGIKGIDEQAGLASVAGNQDLYKVILEKYCEQGRDLLSQLRAELWKTDLQLFVIHVHGLKSASKGIGAMEISEKFKEMEFAGKDNNMDLIEEKIRGYLDELDALMTDIENYLQSGGSDKPDVSVLKEMRDKLDDMDVAGFDELLEQVLEGSYAADVAEKLKRMQQLYEDFEFGEVADILEQLIES